MERSQFLRREKAWVRFQKWEACQQRPSSRSTFSAIGEWVDFFLSKHPVRSAPPDVRGIRQMRKRLPRLLISE